MTAKQFRQVKLTTSYPYPWKQLGDGGYMVLGQPGKSRWTWKGLADGLAKINRYDGSTQLPYSVAQHCCIMHDHASRADRFHALMHDAPEWIIGDENAPRKQFVRQQSNSIRRDILELLPDDPDLLLAIDRQLSQLCNIIPDLEGRIFELFYARAGQPLPDFDARKRIKHLDLRALVTEQRDLMDPNPTKWDWVTGYSPFNRTIKPWPWVKASDEFLKRLQFFTEVKR